MFDSDLHVIKWSFDLWRDGVTYKCFDLFVFYKIWRNMIYVRIVSYTIIIVISYLVHSTWTAWFGLLLCYYRLRFKLEYFVFTSYANLVIIEILDIVLHKLYINCKCICRYFYWCPFEFSINLRLQCCFSFQIIDQ